MPSSSAPGAHPPRRRPPRFVCALPACVAAAAAGSAPLAAWEPPKIAMPRYCGHDVGPKNREYLLYANHPCQFFNNATAAMIAADFT